MLVTLYLLLTHTNCSYWSIASTSWRNHWPDRLSQSDSMVLSLVWQFIPFGCMVVSSSFCVWKKKSVVSAPIYRPVRLTFFTLYFVVQIHISQTFTPSFQNKNFQSLIIWILIKRYSPVLFCINKNRIDIVRDWKFLFWKKE